LLKAKYRFFSDSGCVIKRPHRSSTVYGASPFTGNLFLVSLIIVKYRFLQLQLRHLYLQPRSPTDRFLSFTGHHK